jgi:hypothetical protein
MIRPVPLTVGHKRDIHMTTETDRHEDGTIDVVQSTEASSSARPAELERLYWEAIRRTTFGLVRYGRDAIRPFGSGPALIAFGPLTAEGARAIVGGLFARRPHGVLRWSAADGRIVVAVERFAPLLRGPLWHAESWFHGRVGRRFLTYAARQGG